MYARVHTLEKPPDQHDEGLEITRDHLLPWLRESSGFCGLIRLVARDRGEIVVVTLWKDAESLAGSTDAAERFSDLGATASGARRRSLGEYEVTLFEVPEVAASARRARHGDARRAQ